MAAGLTALTPAQLKMLDQLVARDVSLAHQGGVSGFGTSFTERHGGAEASLAGLDRLDPSQRSRIDRLVASALAAGPEPLSEFTYQKPAAPAQEVDITPPHVEVHGDVGFTVGGGSHGTSFYGASADVFVTDPSGQFTLGVGYSTLHFKGKGAPCLYADPFGGL